jgi:hypothetical protein
MSTVFLKNGLMVKKMVLLQFFLALTGLIDAQVDSSEFREYAFYVYRTEEDFFKGRKSYRGQFTPSEDTRIIRYKTENNKKATLDLKDSCNQYFGYQLGDETQIRPGTKNNDPTYYVFGGGNPECYCVVYGQLPNYDRKGYLLGLTTPGDLVMYFVDRANHAVMVSLRELLSLKPRLLEIYTAEKTRTDKNEWERKRLATGVRYLKLYIAERAK